MTTKVVIIGAGVIGMTTAMRVLESVDDVDVTVVAENFTPQTTSDVSSGMIEPLRLRGVPEAKVRPWSQEGLDYFYSLFQFKGSRETGLSLVPVYRLSENEIVREANEDLFLHFRELTQRELKMFPSKYRYGDYHITVTVDCEKYIKYLMKRFQRKGGRFVQNKVSRLEDLGSDYDVIINCSGVGARELTPDTDVYPIRGQAVRVRAPWVKYVVLVLGGCYVTPSVDHVTLGASWDVGEWSLSSDPETTKALLEECIELVPCLKGAETVAVTVGLRPGRREVRVEREDRVSNSGETLHVIHNYGHGSHGVTLSWGSAGDVMRLVQQVIQEKLAGDIRNA